MIKSFVVALCSVFALSFAAHAKTEAHKKIFFVTPKMGAKIDSKDAAKLKVQFGVDKSLKVTPAGQEIDNKKSGHHHLLIDTGAIKAGDVVPVDDKHIHYGKGQTETEITLTPGKHTLTLQFADGLHRSYGPEYSDTIEVTVINSSK
jgi:hypothetical protein